MFGFVEYHVFNVLCGSVLEIYCVMIKDTHSLGQTTLQL